MRTFYLTNDNFTGEIELVYSDDNLLKSYDIRADLTPQAKADFLRQIPRSIVALQNFVNAKPARKLTELKAEISFNDFWNLYDDKVSSSRKRTLARWNKMTRAEQIKAHNFITRYKLHLPPGTRPKFAETYLNAELWNN